MSDISHKKPSAYELILQFEHDCDPFRYESEGFSIWPLFRFVVWEHLHVNMGELSPRRSSAPRSGLLAKSTAAFAALAATAKRSAFQARDNKYDVVVLTTTDRLRDKVKQRYKNVYFDYCDPPLPNTLYVFVDPKRDRLPETDPVLFAGFRSDRQGLFARVRGKRVAAVAALQEELSSFLKHVACDSYLRLPVSWWSQRFERARIRFSSFRRLFDSVKPKVVITESYYNKVWAVAAAKSFGIPVIELQHGIVYDGHMAYTFDREPAMAHRDRLPLPDKFFSFGQHFSDVLVQRGFWSHSDVPAVGFPRMEHHQVTFKYRLREPGEKLKVLVSSQWIMTSKLVAFLKDALGRLSCDVVVSVKPHPYELDTTGYQQIDGLDLIASSEEFYDVVQQHHVHCSVFSTTLLESIGLGVPTIILGLPGSENALAITDKGHCRVARTPEEFAATLTEAAASQDVLTEWHQKTKQNRSHFWEPGASANIHAAVSKIVDRAT